MFGLLPIRDWLYIGAMAAILAFGTWLYFHVKDIGYQECQTKVQRAIQQQQNIADQNAEVYQAQQIKIRTIYRIKREKVIEHVPVNHSCDLPNPIVGMLNNAISGTSQPTR